MFENSWHDLATLQIKIKKREKENGTHWHWQMTPPRFISPLKLKQLNQLQMTRFCHEQKRLCSQKLLKKKSCILI